MEREKTKITESIIEICFYMRGSITWEHAWNLSLNDINLVIKQIKKNIDTTNKTGIPII